MTENSDRHPLDIDVWGNDLDQDAHARNENRARQNGLEPCERCGRGVKAGAGWWIEVVNGGSSVARPGSVVDVNDPGYMGCYILGSECAKRVPLAFRTHY